MKKYWCLDQPCQGLMRRVYMRIFADGKAEWKGTKYWMCEKCSKIKSEEELVFENKRLGYL